MKTSISKYFKHITPKTVCKSLSIILVFFLLFNIKANSQNHCLVIKNISINTTGGPDFPYCDGSTSGPCNPSEFIELFNVCDSYQNFGCYIICDGDWCVRISSTIPDLPPGGTIVLGSVFSPGFDFSNPFHIDIHSCNNCAWYNPDNGNTPFDFGALSNAGEQVILYNAAGDLEMGVYWGGGDGYFGSLDAIFGGACPIQNLIFPDPNDHPKFIDLGNLASGEACTISIPCATITDNNVSADAPEALCALDGQNIGIGSSPFSQIGPFNTSTSCFYEGNSETFTAFFEPQNFLPPPLITWSSPTGLIFNMSSESVVSFSPVVDVLFTSSGNHIITTAIQLPDDDCIYYYSENIFVEDNVDFSNIQFCLDEEFIISETPAGMVLNVIVLFGDSGIVIAPPQTTIPASFIINNSFGAGNYVIRFHGFVNGNPCVVEKTITLEECNAGCVDHLIIDVNTPFKNLYQSNNTITTQGAVIIQNTQQVEYRSNRITIYQGFVSQAGVDFKVSIGGCY